MVQHFFFLRYMRDQQSSLRSFLWVRKANAGKQGESKCDFLAFLTGKFPSEILSCPPRLGDLPARNVAKGIAQKSGASAERNRQLRQSHNDQITFQQRKNILGVICIVTILSLNHILNWIDLFWQRKYCIQKIMDSGKIALHLLFGWSLDKDKKSLDQSKQIS